MFKEFREISAKEWKQKIQFELKGKDYNKSLLTPTKEGINIKPFYHQDDKTTKNFNNPPSSWKICHKIIVQNAIEGNSEAKIAIKNGAESLRFQISKENIQLKQLLSDIDPQIIILIEPLFLSVEFSEQLKEVAANSAYKIHFLVDIIGNLATTGNWYFNLKKDFSILRDVSMNTQNLESNILINTGLLQNAGATIIQELAYGLAHAHEYINYFFSEEKSILSKQSFLFSISIGPNYFFELSKIRALRKMWEILTEEYDLLNKCYIFAVPSLRNKTSLDYNMNLLRTTTENMSAILGGADIIENISYDTVYATANNFSSRLAGNQLQILKKESSFDKISHASNGSYYIETVTNQLVEKALDLFKNIEKGGGYLQQLKSGTIQKKIKESAGKEQKAFDEGEIILTGINSYKDPHATIPVFQKSPVSQKKIRKTLLEPVIPRRLSEKMETKLIKEHTL